MAANGGLAAAVDIVDSDSPLDGGESKTAEDASGHRAGFDSTGQPLRLAGLGAGSGDASGMFREDDTLRATSEHRGTMAQANARAHPPTATAAEVQETSYIPTDLARSSLDMMKGKMAEQRKKFQSELESVVSHYKRQEDATQAYYSKHMSELRDKAKTRITELKRLLEEAKSERDRASQDLSRVRRETVDARRTIDEERRRAREEAERVRREGAGALESERESLQKQLDQQKRRAQQEGEGAMERFTREKAELDARLAAEAAARSREAQAAETEKTRLAAELLRALEASEAARGEAGVLQASLRRHLRAEQRASLELRDRIAALTSSGENVPKEALEGAERRLKDSESRRQQLQQELDGQAELARNAQRARDAAEEKAKEALREADEAREAAAEARRGAAQARAEAGRSASLAAGAAAAAHGQADAMAADLAAEEAGKRAAASRERLPEQTATAAAAAGEAPVVQPIAGAPSAAPSAVASAAMAVEQSMAAEEDEAELAELRERLEELLREQRAFREGPLSRARQGSEDAAGDAKGKADHAKALKDKHKKLKDGIKQWQDAYKAKHGKDPSAEAKLEIKDQFAAYKASSAESKAAKAEAKAAEEAAAKAQAALGEEQQRDLAMEADVQEVKDRIDELERALKAGGGAGATPRAGGGAVEAASGIAAPASGAGMSEADHEQLQQLRREVQSLRSQLVDANQRADRARGDGTGPSGESTGGSGGRGGDGGVSSEALSAAEAAKARAEAQVSELQAALAKARADAAEAETAAKMAQAQAQASAAAAAAAPQDEKAAAAARSLRVMRASCTETISVAQELYQQKQKRECRAALEDQCKRLVDELPADDVVDGEGKPLPGVGLKGGIEDAVAAAESLNAAEGGLVLRRALDTFIEAVDHQLVELAASSSGGGPAGGGAGGDGGAIAAQLGVLQEQMKSLSEARKAAEADAESARAKLAQQASELESARRQESDVRDRLAQAEKDAHEARAMAAAGSGSGKAAAPAPAPAPAPAAASPAAISKARKAAEAAEAKAAKAEAEASALRSKLKKAQEKTKEAEGAAEKAKSMLKRATGGDKAAAKKEAERAKAQKKQMDEMRAKLRAAEKAAAEAGSEAAKQEQAKQQEKAERRMADAQKAWDKEKDQIQAKADAAVAALKKDLAAAQKHLEKTEQSLAASGKEVADLKAKVAALGAFEEEAVALREEAKKAKELEAELKSREKRFKEMEKELRKEQILRKEYWNEMEDMKGKIRVYCRARPMSKSEQERGCHQVVAFPDPYTIQLDIRDKGHKQFLFDRCFGPGSTQEDIFKDTERLINGAFDGFNVCIFAYGQTGSGKTFTMLGAPGMEGVTPRAIKKLFSTIEDKEKQLQVTVQCSMIELYNDNLRDLLWMHDHIKEKSAKPPKLDIKLDAKKLVYVKGSVTKPAKTPEEALAIFHEGNGSRATGSTKMNAESSRSHLVFTLLVESYNKQSKKTARGKISLVDLAGSERVDKTGAEADRLREAQSINKSLSALGNVISVLSSGSSGHVPYRDNKLTHLMMDSIGGNSKTLMFVNLSPADYNTEETQTSLVYAARVKLITNAAEKQSDSAEVSRLRRIIKKLKKGETIDEEEDTTADAESGASGPSGTADGAATGGAAAAEAADGGKSKKGKKGKKKRK